jgi:hypothetical protein
VVEDDLDARLERLRAKVAQDRCALQDLRRQQQAVAAHSAQIREMIRDWLDRMHRPTTGR